ncbi:GL14524 [Drosophila persimilis]|uniref:Proteasome subunit beta n=1 Tax=Drosophila persimilis TaxID=7234 RepID=B4GQ86_DROPE|nr:proteasome subunit beta type-5 [Drosophila persimilis]EDW39758.1 GL14524 [Drosophila persimilis]
MSLEELCGLKAFLKTTNWSNSMRQISEHDFQEITSNFNNPYRLMAPVPGTPDLTNASLKIDHGTTALGFVYQGGIVLCADSRSSSGINVTTQTMDKIVPVSSQIVGTLAGGSADCTYWYRVLARESRLHELRYKRPMSVDAAAKMICHVSEMHRGTGLNMGMLLAGYSPKGPSLVYVDSDGVNISGKRFSVGSGASNALGILDPMYRFDLTDEEAFDLALQSLCQATLCDASTGGMVVLHHVGPAAHRIVRKVDCMELHKKYSLDARNFS